MSSPQSKKSLVAQLLGLGLIAAIAAALIYAGGMTIKVLDRMNGPNVTVSACENANTVVSITADGDSTLLGLALADNRIVTVRLQPDAQTQLVPNRWEDGQVTGYASLSLEATDTANSYVVRIPAGETLLLDNVEVRCNAYGTNLTVSIATWTWMPGFDNRVHLFAKL